MANNNRSFTDKELMKAVESSINLSQVCKKLSLYKCGSTYNVLNRSIVRLNIDTSHFKLETDKKRNKLPTEKILVKNSPYLSGTSNLKSRLLKEGLLSYVCYKCGISEWCGEELILQLDHINGDRYDNRLKNLRLLCPNCHSQTETYAGKRHKKGEMFCSCGKKIYRTSKKCRKCQAENRLGKGTKINWPLTKELLKMVEKKPYTVVAKELGVSDNAIRKRIQNHPIK